MSLHEIASPEAMFELGKKIGSIAEAGDLILLNGPLGAGKTVLVQGIGAALGITDVTSPTFVISRIHKGATPLIHVDVYRLLEAGKAALYLDDLDLDSPREEAVTVIEWGGEESARLSEDRLEIDIDRSGDIRKVSITPVGRTVEWSRAMTVSLTIDTSTSRTIVGLADGEKVLFESFSEGATDHGRAVSDLVSQALADNPAPTQVVVGMGPGPFTGLRVGIAFARTFALAREIPVIGICSLDAITVDESSYTVAIDARRKEIYWAKYKDGVRIEGPSVSKPSEVENFLIDRYPSVVEMVRLSRLQNESEPFYLRRPDAVPTAERR